MTACLWMLDRFTVRHIYRESLSILACASSPFVVEGRMWNLIVLVPDHCLSFCSGSPFKHDYALALSGHMTS